MHMSLMELSPPHWIECSNDFVVTYINFGPRSCTSLISYSGSNVVDILASEKSRPESGSLDFTSCGLRPVLSPWFASSTQ